MKHIVVLLLFIAAFSSKVGYGQESDFYSDDGSGSLPFPQAYDLLDTEEASGEVLIEHSGQSGDSEDLFSENEDELSKVLDNEDYLLTDSSENLEEDASGSGEIPDDTSLLETASEPENELETNVEDCETSSFGCCSDSHLPAHGPNQEGCCLQSEFGCCPDNIRPANGPNVEGCGCETSEHGCCPDGKTVQRGGNLEGCGCAVSEFGCCQDQHSPAEGANFAGCPCHTSDYGCCEDGVTLAGGPDKEECQGCEVSAFGCCPDGFTPAQGEDMEGCACAGSEYGCCPDGEGQAEGPDFEGCATKPGEACHMKEEKGTCEDFSVKWYFDGKEGRCSRFWYGGCEGNINRFEDINTCEETCVNPPGSGRCYLPKVRGICEGEYERFYYDATYKQCVSFTYGGCLGNANRFQSKLECEQSCVRSDSLAICEQPAEPGPCMGNFTRWAYDENTGECDSFAYGGCHGNKNRFMTQEDCENSCMHKRLTLLTNRMCKQPIEAGSCNDTLPRWAFDEGQKKCVPFYYSGCEGNSNSFETIDECEQKCPDAFPPELEVVNKILNIEEGTEAVLEIFVEGNPFPEIVWQHDSVDIQPDDHYQIRDDRSLVIKSTQAEDAGSWMVIANNGVGKVARKQISLSVYPSQVPITVEISQEAAEYKTGDDIRLECRAEGFPIPSIQWLKNNARLPKSTRIYVEDEKVLVVKNASPIDGGVYICRAQNENMRHQAVVDISVEQGEVPLQCEDQPAFANCALIVRARYCAKSEQLAKLCCKSCVESGQIAGPPA